MNIESYLSHFKDGSQITLVGPLYEMCGAVTLIEEPIIFVDGGARWRKSRQGIVVGDGDSFVGRTDVLLETDKCFSDLAFVLENIPHSFCTVKLLGFLGGRRDHELFNLGEAHHFLSSRKLPTTLQFDNKIIGYSSGRWQFERVGGFSLAVVEEARVSISGDCRYCCPQTRFAPLRSLGLSNVGNGLIEVHCDKPIFILFEDRLSVKAD